MTTTQSSGICGQTQADGTICMNAAGCRIPHPTSSDRVGAKTAADHATMDGGYGGAAEAAPSQAYPGGDNYDWVEASDAIEQSFSFRPSLHPDAEAQATEIAQRLSKAMREPDSEETGPIKEIDSELLDLNSTGFDPYYPASAEAAMKLFRGVAHREMCRSGIRPLDDVEGKPRWEWIAPPESLNTATAALALSYIKEGALPSDAWNDAREAVQEIHGRQLAFLDQWNTGLASADSRDEDAFSERYTPDIDTSMKARFERSWKILSQWGGP